MCTGMQRLAFIGAPPKSRYLLQQRDAELSEEIHVQSAVSEPYRSLHLLCNQTRYGFMAEREGFEPPIALRLCLISSQVHSTGLCHLSAPGRPNRRSCGGNLGSAMALNSLAGNPGRDKWLRGRVRVGVTAGEAA
jgi:hypothetical protein